MKRRSLTDNQCSSSTACWWCCGAAQAGPSGSSAAAADQAGPTGPTPDQRPEPFGPAHQRPARPHQSDHKIAMPHFALMPASPALLRLHSLRCYLRLLSQPQLQKRQPRNLPPGSRSVLSCRHAARSPQPSEPNTIKVGNRTNIISHADRARRNATRTDTRRILIAATDRAS